VSGQGDLRQLIGGDLAVLKTLGFSPGQLRRTVAWQANTVAVLALAVGAPLGPIVGRWTWLLFAHQLGVLAVPTFSLSTGLVLVVGALLVANVIASVPGYAAGRTRAGRILRAA
jgi:putative ABC transport system permease protein